jgi:hypothetical protein
LLGYFLWWLCVLDAPSYNEFLINI